ncbi:hypothetical protein MGN70_011960 [Eutypa lata]|nr:hypothetical protein MGN70_011960 [Eutypa lata]
MAASLLSSNVIALPSEAAATGVMIESLPLNDRNVDRGTLNANESELLETAEEPDMPGVARQEQSLWTSTLIIVTLSGLTLTSSMTTGLLTVGLPRMAADLSLSDSLLLWPASIYGLTSGCSLLIAGAIADVIGSRPVYLVGCFLLTGFVLGSGLSQTATQLIVFRGGQGVAVSMCLPTAMSLLSAYLPRGKRRNIGFAFFSAGQPLGYSIGLLLGGFFVDSIGWRYGWYLSACVAFAVLTIGVLGLPKRPGGVGSGRLRRILFGIDWVGAVLASASLAMFSYVLAVVSSSTSSIRDATQIVLLCIAAACMPAFAFWMRQQQRRGKPVLIPNSLWKTLSFTTLCVMILLTWAVIQGIENLQSLYFQKVQGLAALPTSLCFIPNIAIGVALSISMGFILHKVSIYWIVLITCCVTAGSPLLMAVNSPDWTYWYAVFWAVLLSPFSANTLFVVSALIITSTFPDDTQALAGAVFNTFSQFGTAIGLAVVAVISSSVSQTYSTSHAHSPAGVAENAYTPRDLLEGYRASFWFLFGGAILTSVIGAFGLRNVSNKGLKTE